MSAISTVNLTKRFSRTSGYRDLLPTSGMARVFGHDIVKEESVVKKAVGLVNAEERSFYWRLTGRENLKFYASLYHISSQQGNQRIDELLDLVGLSGEGDIRFQNYSTGMRQKLAIARGLLSQPQLLFVDEPTRSLDPISARNVRRFFKEKVAGAGKTVVLATHNLEEAEQLCDRLAIMDHGRVIALGSMKELRSLFQTHKGCELQVKNFPESGQSRLKDIEGVLDCRITGQSDGLTTLKLRISDRSEVLPRVLQVMVSGGIEICSCQMQELPLEEIFTHALSGEAGVKN